MSYDDETPAVVQNADIAYEAIRAINHQTFGVIPAPLAYAILGNLKGVGHLMPQALEQIAAGLDQSLVRYDVYDGEGMNPAANVELAGEHLRRAATFAAQVGQELEKAQSAIASQGYRTREDAAI